MSELELSVRDAQRALDYLDDQRQAALDTLHALHLELVAVTDARHQLAETLADLRRAQSL